MSVFDYHKDADGVVTITMDMTGPVNAMNAEFLAAFSDTMERLEAEPELRGVIITSAKKTFVAGGDLNMLIAAQPGDEGKLFDYVERTKAMMRRLETLPVPVVAAINGAALGGGYELALCCNRRIAWDDKSVEIGLPEVGLGLLPGGGGVVRLTHLLGLQDALPFLLEGKKVRGAKAAQAGLIHETVADIDALLPRAKAWILESQDCGADVQPWDQQGHTIPGGAIGRPSVAQVAMLAPHMLKQKTRGNLPGPERILQTAVEAVTIGFDAALRVESRNFASLVTTPQAKNMMTAFFFQLNQVNGGASRPTAPEPSSVTKLGVIGAGMMGQGIAYVAAMAGIPVVLKDVSVDAAAAGKAYSAALLDKAIHRGRADEAKKAAVLSRITPTADNADLAGCDLIIEAVFEDMDLKNTIVRDAEQYVAEAGVWGSNTSTLPITRLAEAASAPERFIGIHFFSPVDKMPLVEIICGEKTNDETLAKAFDFVQQIKKTPIVVTDHVGFYTSRTFGAQLTEAAQLVAEGVDPIRVDNLGKALGMPVGPLTVNDEVSLRLGVEILETQMRTGLLKEDDQLRPEGVALQQTLVKHYNRGGRHHGDGGYFDYQDGQKTLWPKLRELYFKSDVNADVSDQDIKDRLLFSNVNEALKCLEEGVVRTVADANIGSIFGIGAPPWTGGYVQFVNTYGLQNYIDRAEGLAQRYGARFRAPGIVRDTLAAGGMFT